MSRVSRTIVFLILFLAPLGFAGEEKTSNTHQALKKVRILHEGKETLLIVETSEKIEVDPNLQQDKKKLSIALPKTNWIYVDTKEKQGGVIQGYYVDESCPHTSKLILSLKSPVDMTVHPVTKHDDFYEYRIALGASEDSNAPLIQQEESFYKKTPKKKNIKIPQQRKSKEKAVHTLRKPLLKKIQKADLLGKEIPLEDTKSVSKEAVEKAVESSEQAIGEEEKKEPQSHAFKIEGDTACLEEEELKEDLKGLQISLSLHHDEMAYVAPQDLKKDNLKEEPTKLLKKFKISPSQDVPVSKGIEPQHLSLSNAGRMFERLQKTQEAQVSNEGTAPAWVIEAKMKENQGV